MGDFHGSGSRPTFDYVAALTAARQMHTFLSQAEDHERTRNQHRDASLAEWDGVFGDEFRQRAADEDTSFRNASFTIEDDAYGWAKAWLAMVNNMNRYLYGQAYNAQQSYIDSRKSGFLGSLLNEGVEFLTSGPLVYVAGQVVDYVTGGADQALATVPEPAQWRDPDHLPKPPSFYPSFAPFASYYRSGDNLYIHYVNSPPAAFQN